MDVLLPAVAFAAFSVWLTVRCINRREKWAKRTLAAVVGLALYLLSFGPAWGLANRYYSFFPSYCATYWPIGWVAVNSPKPVNVAIRRFANLVGGRFGPTPMSLPTSAWGDSFNP